MSIPPYKKRKSNFDDFVKKAYLVAQEWTMSMVDRVPVPLHELAIVKNIQRIRYEPLLSTSGLVKAKDGFDIFINTEAPGLTHNQKAGTVQEINSTDWSNFDPSLLFGIAHEIAHVIFLDVAESIQKTELLRRRRHETKLESACSNIARMLLIPKQRLIREIEGKLFDTNHIKGLTELFNVSPEVFIWRLPLNDMKDVFKATDGFLIYAHIENKERIRIKACHIWGPLASSVFKIVDTNKQAVLPQGYVLGELPIFKIGTEFDEVNAWLLKSENGKRPLQVTWKIEENSFLPCELNFCRTQNRSDRLLIGIKVAGNIEKRG